MPCGPDGERGNCLAAALVINDSPAALDSVIPMKYSVKTLFSEAAENGPARRRLNSGCQADSVVVFRGWRRAAFV